MANNKDVIKVNLSAASFRRAAKRIRRYSESLDAKCGLFIAEMAKIGYTEIASVLEEHIETGQTIESLVVLEDGSNGHYRARIRVTSDAILFLEFGSGRVGENTAPHAAEFGMGSGTYPSQVNPQDPHGRYENWNNPNGWYFYDDSKRLRHTYGQAASLPMYKGGKEMERQLEKIARKVFR